MYNRRHLDDFSPPPFVPSLQEGEGKRKFNFGAFQIFYERRETTKQGDCNEEVTGKVTGAFFVRFASESVITLQTNGIRNELRNSDSTCPPSLLLSYFTLFLSLRSCFARVN